MKQKVELTKQILRLYVGREATIYRGDIYVHVLEIKNVDIFLLDSYRYIPHLRRLSSITEDEANEFWELTNDREFSKPYSDDFYDLTEYKTVSEWFNAFYGKWGVLQTFYNASEFLYLTGRGFDLFGLIEAGLANEVSE
jgi:hypothetical protein